MKIALPVHHFLPRYNAGAELYTFRLARWLQSHAHSVEVVCIESIDEGSPGELRAEQDTYEGIDVWRLSLNLIDAKNRLPLSYNNRLLGEWFRAYFRRAQPDLAHFQAGYLIGVAPLLAAAEAGIATVLTLHDYWYICPRITLQRGDGSLCRSIPDDPAECAWCMRLERRRYRIPNRLTLGFAGRAMTRFTPGEESGIMADRRRHLSKALLLPRAVIAPSRFLADRFMPYLNPDRLHILRYGINLEPYEKRYLRPADGVMRIGYVGQIAPHKGVHLVVQAFKSLRAEARPIELHIYGGLDANRRYSEHLKHLAGSDPRIFFHGRYENKRAAEILSQFDASVVPSVWYENSPLVILEAHAAGTPVITAALGGMAEMVRDEVDGLLFRAGDAADLARQLRRLIDDPPLLPRLSAGIVKPAGIDDEMEQLLRLYRRALAESAPTPQTAE